ncbi:MAG: hypothetical protein LBL98_03325 [Ruminococcus sp.]|nr:hypothetical protein [Ruminococcus sp.]
MRAFFDRTPHFVFTFLCVVIGVIAIVGGVKELRLQNAPREHIYALSDTKFEPGEYIECTVDYVVENYAETIRTEEVFFIKTSEEITEQHYIIPCFTADDTLYFISAEVSYAPYLTEFNRILELSWSENEADIQSEYFSFTGKVMGIESELLDYAYDTMLEYGYVEDREEFNEVFIPRKITVLRTDDSESVMLFVIGGGAVLLGAGLLVYDIVKAKRKALAEYYERNY